MMHNAKGLVESPQTRLMMIETKRTKIETACHLITEHIQLSLFFKFNDLSFQILFIFDADVFCLGFSSPMKRFVSPLIFLLKSFHRENRLFSH